MSLTCLELRFNILNLYFVELDEYLELKVEAFVDKATLLNIRLPLREKKD